MIENLKKYMEILESGEKYDFKTKKGVPRRKNAVVPHIVWGITRKMQSNKQISYVPDIYAQRIVGNLARAEHINRQLAKGRIILAYHFPTDADIESDPNLKRLMQERNGGENPYKDIEALCKVQMMLVKNGMSTVQNAESLRQMAGIEGKLEKAKKKKAKAKSKPEDSTDE